LLRRVSKNDTEKISKAFVNLKQKMNVDGLQDKMNVEMRNIKDKIDDKTL
jgi:hypothetical protein